MNETQTIRKNCPECTADLHIDAKTCWHCDWGRTPKPQSTQTALTPEQMVEGLTHVIEAHDHNGFYKAEVIYPSEVIALLTQERAATEKLREDNERLGRMRKRCDSFHRDYDRLHERAESAEALLKQVEAENERLKQAECWKCGGCRRPNCTGECENEHCNCAEARLKQVEVELVRVREAYSWFTDEIRKAVHGDEWGHGRDHQQYVYDVAGMKMQKELAESRTGRLERILVGATAIVYSDDTIMGAERLDDFRKQLRLPTTPEGSKP